MWSGRLIPTKPVGQDHLTNIEASETTTEVKCETKSIIICVPQRTTQFKLRANGTIGVRPPNPQKIRPQGIVGTPLNKWVVPGNFHRSLSLL